MRLGHITESGRLPTTGGGRRLGEIALKIESKFEKKIFVLKRFQNQIEMEIEKFREVAAFFGIFYKI